MFRTGDAGGCATGPVVGWRRRPRAGGVEVVGVRRFKPAARPVLWPTAAPWPRTTGAGSCCDAEAGCGCGWRTCEGSAERGRDLTEGDAGLESASSWAAVGVRAGPRDVCGRPGAECRRLSA